MKCSYIGTPTDDTYVNTITAIAYPPVRSCSATEKLIGLSGVIDETEAQRVTGQMSKTAGPLRPAAGYEDLAKSLVSILDALDSWYFDPDATAEIRMTASAALHEITTDVPNRAVVRRAVATIRGILASVATGVNETVSAHAAAAAQTASDALAAYFPVF